MKLKYLLLLLPCCGPALSALPLDSWLSETTGEEISREVILPQGADTSSPMTTAIYLKNLSSPRVGREPDEDIIDSFLEQDMLVIVMDYGNHPKARVPFLNRDLFNIRDNILDDQTADAQNDTSPRKFPVPYAMDAARIFIIPEGCRLLQNVTYEGPRGMDIIYPSDPLLPVGAILEFSADNKDRMGNFSMAFTHDTILTAQASEGFAAAMASHPVTGGYGGIDYMPMCGIWVRAAVRALRAQAETLPLNGKIATLGFSRGSGMALMAATTQAVVEWNYYTPTEVRKIDDAWILSGDYETGDHSVQGAIVMSGRFTYIDLLPTDQRASEDGIYTQSWGPIDENFEKWKDHGALDYLTEDPGFPIFLTINNDDEDAVYQMDVLKQRLTELGVDYIFLEDTEEPLAHRMPLVPEILNAMNRYLKEVLLEPNPYTSPGAMQPVVEVFSENQVSWTAPDFPMPPADYVLQVSPDMTDWSNTTILHPDEAGILQYEMNLEEGEHAFFRLLPPADPEP